MFGNLDTTYELYFLEIQLKYCTSNQYSSEAHMKTIDEIASLIAEQRKKLGIEQKDMYLRIGMKQQQYQRIESGNDIKLSTLLRVLEGLDLELSINAKNSNVNSAIVGTTIANKREVDLNDDVDDLDFWFKTKE